MNSLKVNKGKLVNGVITVGEIIFARTVMSFDQFNQGVWKMDVMPAVGKVIWQRTVGMLKGYNNNQNQSPSAGRLGRGIDIV